MPDPILHGARGSDAYDTSPRPCPFCGNDAGLNDGGFAIVENDGRGFVVRCYDCDAMGPPDQYERAIARWNERG